MYNWDFCDQNMSLARLVRWVVARSVVELSAVIVQRTEIKYIYIPPHLSSLELTVKRLPPP